MKRKEVLVARESKRRFRERRDAVKCVFCSSNIVIWSQAEYFCTTLETPHTGLCVY